MQPWAWVMPKSEDNIFQKCSSHGLSQALQFLQKWNSGFKFQIRSTMPPFLTQDPYEHHEAPLGQCL